MHVPMQCQPPPPPSMCACHVSHAEVEHNQYMVSMLARLHVHTLTVVCAPVLVEQVPQNGEVVLVPKELPALWVLVDWLRPLRDVTRDLCADVGSGRVHHHMLVPLPEIVAQLA
eukprot:142428-Chlamydomonas_euryale.AAC.4